MIPLIENLKFILPAIGTDESRKNLMWAKCWIKDEYLYMIAADGFMIKTVKTWLNQPHDYSNSYGKEFYIDRESVKAIIKNTKKDSVFNLFTDKIFVDNITIRFKEYNLDYPNLEKLINADIQTKKSMFAINCKFIAKACKNASFKNRHIQPLKIEFLRYTKSDEHGLIKIDFMNGEQFAYIMPTDIK
jgi:hypothetical protein